MKIISEVLPGRFSRFFFNESTRCVDEPSKEMAIEDILDDY